MTARLRAPWPWLGNKVDAAPFAERLMGPIDNLVIPFAGGLGELLGRSRPVTSETVNDLDCFVVNAWRALKHAPAQLAELCDYPVHEATLHAAHGLLLARADELDRLINTDPEAFDLKVAAWWIWGASCWLGSGWCRRTDGPPKRQLPLLRGSDGTGVGYGAGVNLLENRGQLLELFSALEQRLRWVRITCGDWQRILGRSITVAHGPTGVSLDPPYRADDRTSQVYREDDPDLSYQTELWAAANDGDPMLRIVLHGRGDEHDGLLARGWTRHLWRRQGDEVIWASPSCIVAPRQADLFA